MAEIEIAGESCADCGTSLFADAKFCNQCGLKVSAAESQTARKAVAEFAQGTASEARNLAIETMKNQDVRKVLAGAALGAVIAPVIPLVTIPMGAVLGGGYVLYKRLTR